jgi:predicted RNA-binding Zn ribbon-like protein
MMVSMNSVDWQAVVVGLLNTTPVVDGVVMDVLADDAAARTWLRAHGGGRPDDLADLAELRRVRDDLQRVAWGECAAEELGAYVSGVRQVPRLSADGVTWSLDAADWAARVVLAWGAIQSEAPGRLRPCANDECRLFLFDRSRAGTARWCSMSGCGNRMKARRHHQRVSGKSSD